MSRLLLVSLLLLPVAGVSCADDTDAGHGSGPPARLSSYGLFTWDGSEVQWSEDVLPYTLNTELFSDYATKERALRLPPGVSGTYKANDAFELPVGSVLIKSFILPADLREPEGERRLVETRLLVHEEDGWKGWPYVWLEDGSDAVLKVAGDVQQVEIIDTHGELRPFSYLVPQRNQCVDCHELKSEAGDRYTTPIGPKARHLHRPASDGSGNQLEQWAALGALTDLPELEDVEPAFDFRLLEESGVDDLSFEEVTRAARDYLDINCAHCHHPMAVEGRSSQLFLNHDNDDLFNLGVCKLPGSAGKGGFGRDYNIVPGHPDQSILVYRMETEHVGAMMPDIGRSLAHEEGVALVRAWISQMEPAPCTP